MEIKKVAVGMLETNCYIVVDELTNSAAVIDPGGELDRICQAIGDLSVKLIIITHAHFDHYMAAEALQRKTGAQIYAHEMTVEAMNTPGLSVTPAYLREGFKMPVCDISLTDGDIFVMDNLTFQAVFTPGHSTGDCCFICDNALFTGDVVFYNDVGRTDLPGGNYNTLLKSLAKIAALDGDYTVYPGHGPNSTLACERKNNQYIQLSLQENDKAGTK